MICDFNLPGMNGEKLFEELRRRLGARLPQFVFIYDRRAGVVVRYGAISGIGRTRGLQKPFQLSALAALVAEILQPQTSPAS